jgi:hypothetical protein
VQRVGRAGRSDKVLRVALGVLVVTNSPSQFRYVIGDEHLRLIRPQVEIPVAWENEEIKKQHLIFSLLDILASQGHPTFLDYTTEVKPSWMTIADVIHSLKAIIAEARRNASLIFSYLNSIYEEPGIQRTFEEILDSIMRKVYEAESQTLHLSFHSIEDSLKNLRSAEDQLITGLRRLEEIRNCIEELLSKLSIQELAEYKQMLANVQETLRNVLSELDKLWG